MNNKHTNSTIGRIYRIAVSGGALALVFLLAPSASSALDPVDNGCMRDVAGFNLNCTANDVSIANATNIVILDDGCAFLNDSVTFRADFEVLLTAQARHDIGIFFSNDGDLNGDGALTGGCWASTVPIAPDPPWLDLDGTDDDPGGVIQDECGDIDAAHNPLFPNLTLTVQCVDDDGDGFLDLPYCTSWRQPGANDLCTTPLDAFPGAPSKCRCDDEFNVEILVPNKQIEVIKELIPSTDTGLFDLQIAGNTEKADATDGDTTGIVTVEHGTVSVGEVAGTGTDLSRYDSSIVCVERGTTTEVDSCTDCTSLDLTVPNAETDWICTITNELKEGSITVIKVVDNGDGGDAEADDFTIFLGDSGNTSFAGEADPGTTTTFDAGTSYNVTEEMGAFTGQYTESKSGDCSGTIEAGVDKTCTITNDDIAPKLTLIKDPGNDDGGNAQPDDFNLTVGGNGVSSGATNTYMANTPLAIDETLVTGYTFVSITGDAKCPAALGGTVTLAPGDDITCTITNDDIRPQLTLIKDPGNDDGGNAQPNDFLLTVGGGGVLSGVKNSYDANTPLAINETLVTGYTFVSITGDAKCPAALGGTVTLAPGDDITCTITNDDIRPQLTLIKDPGNDDGGNAQPDDFNLTVGGGGVLSGVKNSYDANTPLAINETLVTGYTFVSITGNAKCPAVLGGTVTLDEGDDITCTIVNDDIAPKLTLIKDPGNDDGGNAQPNDFQLTVGGAGVLSGVKNSYAANTPLAIDETQVDGYTFVEITGDAKCPAVLGGTVTLDEGDDITCTIKNDDVAPKLTLIKDPTNDSGGNAQPNDFQLTVGGSGVLSGVKNTYSANTPLAIDETQITGYTFVSITGDAKCPAVLGGTVSLDEGDDITCTIVNDDSAPKLTLIKDPTNDDGGNAQPNDFQLTVGGAGVLSGVKNTYSANTPLTINETQLTGYTFVSITGDAKCPAALGGTISLDEGDDITCTIKNDDVAPKLTLIKDPTNDSGGNAQPDDFQLTVGGSGVLSGVKNTYTANTPLAIDETLVDGYTFVSITGHAKCPAVLGGTVTLDEGDDITCTIKNDDQAPTITLIKDVMNDDGGNAGVNDFGLTIGGTPVDSGQTLTVSANQAYALNEAGLVGYNFVSIGAGAGDSAKCPNVLTGTVTADEGENIVCTIKNDDIAPTITLIKDVMNDNGGNAGVNDFGLTIGGTSVNSGQALTISANQAYALNEAGLAGYSFVSIGAGAGDSAKCPSALNGNVTADEGENIVCTIKNDDQAPTITLIKDVMNDDGGNAGVNDFGLTIGGTSVNSGQALTVTANQAYALNEAGLVGYNFVSIGAGAGDSAKCPSVLNGTVSADEGEDIVCTIKNDDVAPKLTLIKDPTNDNGGSALPDAFQLTVGGSGVLSGVTNTYMANTPLAIDETLVAGYAFVSITGNAECPGALGGTVTLDEGEEVTCTITNDDIAPGLTIIKNVVGPTPASPWDFTAPALTLQNGFSLPAAGGQQSFTPAASTYTITEDLYPTGDASSEWALTSIQCEGVEPLGSSPDRGVILPLPLAAQAACTFTNQYAEIDLEKSCVSKAPEVGDTVLFSIRAMNLGTAPVAVTLDDDKIPAIDGVQFELAADDGTCEPGEFLDSDTDPAAGGGDGCVEFIEPVVIDMPFFDVENEAALTASQLAGNLSDVSVSLLAEAADVCEVPGPATRTRGFWGGRIFRDFVTGELEDGFTCYAFESWVLPQYPGGIDLGYVSSPVASCEDLSAWFFSHSAKNSDDSRRKRSCQTDYQVSIHLAVLILNTWLPQNAEPLPGDTVAVREKDVFDFFPNFPAGDGTPETSMLDLIDLLLSAHRSDQVTDPTDGSTAPCNDSCKRALGGYADMIANSGDNEAIIIDDEEMSFGGDYHADPQASRAGGEHLVPNFDCAVRGQGNPNDDRVITQDPNGPTKPTKPNGPLSPSDDAKPPVKPKSEPVGDDKGTELREASPAAEEFFSDVEAGDLATPDAPTKADVWGQAGSEPTVEALEPASDGNAYFSGSRQLSVPPARADSSDQLGGETDPESSLLRLEPSWFGIDEETGSLVGLIRVTLDASEEASSLWLTDLQIAVDQRLEGDTVWYRAADTAECAIGAELPLELIYTEDDRYEADFEFRCDNGSRPALQGSEVRIRLSGHDSSGLPLRPLTRGKKL